MNMVEVILCIVGTILGICLTLPFVFPKGTDNRSEPNKEN